MGCAVVVCVATLEVDTARVLAITISVALMRVENLKLFPTDIMPEIKKKLEGHT